MTLAERKLKHYLDQAFLSFCYSEIYLFLLSYIHDALKARIFKNNTITLKIYVLQRAGGKTQSLARQSLQRTFIIFKK